MDIKGTFKKQGGFDLLHKYYKSGALFTAFAEFLLLGKSRTALEILRLAANFKTKENLKKKYRKKLAAYAETISEDSDHRISNKVWICWFQGLENAPQVVRTCIDSVKRNLYNKEVIVITSENMMDYVRFPQIIIDKWKKGVITNTHMTDLLRLELLIKYGGTWIDATVLCTSKEDDIPDYFFNSDLFFFQCLKPGRDGHSKYMSSWLISAKTNNRILMMTRYLCYEYWKTHNYMIDYFLLHDFMSIALEYYSEDWGKIVPRDNATPHELLLRLFDNYDASIMNAIEEQTPFHKLSYKFAKSELDKEHTFYKYIIK